MKLLEERILKDGAFLGKDILKVDSFLNHQIDVTLLAEMGKEWKKLYEGKEITKILTIEASGIGIACMAAAEFGVPVVFAKKSKSINVGNDFYSAKAYSFTHQNTNDIIVSKKYLTKGEKIFIIDDFLANGAALAALVDICREAEVEVVGIGIAIEKWYQGGGDKIRAQGYRIDSLAKIKSMDENGICFMD